MVCVLYSKPGMILQSRKDEIMWYPGHISKARKAVERMLKMVNVVVEVRDARAPMATSAYGVDLSRKKRIVLLNKEDLADDDVARKWIDFFRKNGESVLSTSKFEDRKAFMKKLGMYLSSGDRVMILGVPNTGKSTIINKIKGRRVSAVGGVPGITKGVQWIAFGRDKKLLDTPGILYKKLFSKELSAKLLLVGSLPVERVDFKVMEIAFDIFKNRTNEQRSFMEFLEFYGRKRGILIKGGEIDHDKAAYMLFTEIANGKFGKISFEIPEEF